MLTIVPLRGLLLIKVANTLPFSHLFHYKDLLPYMVFEGFASNLLKFSTSRRYPSSYGPHPKDNYSSSKA